MFLFESSKDKQLKRIIDTKFNEALTSETKYESNKVLLQSYCQGSDKKAIERLVDIIKQTIKDDDSPPRSKFYALKILQDVMKAQSNVLGNYVVKKALTRLTILAAHRKESKDQNRGKSIFGKVKSDQEAYAKRFHLLLLDSLREWGTTWPRRSDGPHLAFKQKYQELVKEKVVFPSVSGAVTSDVQKQKLKREKEELNGLNNPKKLISPERRESHNRSQFSSGNAAKAIDKNKILEIHTFMINIDESFNLMEEMTANPEPQVLDNVAQDLHKQLMRGDEYVSYLLSHNTKDFQLMISDITADFTFLQEIKHDIKSLKTPESKSRFLRKYKLKFEERRTRRRQNELQAQPASLQPADNNPQPSITNLARSKIEEEKPNFQYPLRRQPLPSTQQPVFGHTAYDQNSKVQSRQQDHPSPSAHPSRGNRDNRADQPRSSSSSQTDKQSDSSKKDSHGSIPHKPESNQRTQVKPPTQTSSQNIHSTSIMRKLQTLNVIAQQESKEASNPTGKSYFASSSNDPFGDPAPPAKSNPFSSFEDPPKQSRDDSDLSRGSSYKEPRTTGKKGGLPPDPQGQNSYGMNQSMAPSNPFEESFQNRQENSNPFQSQMFDNRVNESNISNPFSCKKSFSQRSNPFLDGSANLSQDGSNTQLEAYKDAGPKDDLGNTDRNFNQVSETAPHVNPGWTPALPKEPSEAVNQPSRNQGVLGESAFMGFKKHSLKQNFFAQFSDAPRPNLEIDQFRVPLAIHESQLPHQQVVQVEDFFGPVKASNIFAPKDMVASNINDFGWPFLQISKHKQQPDPNNEHTEQGQHQQQPIQPELDALQPALAEVPNGSLFLQGGDLEREGGHKLDLIAHNQSEQMDPQELTFQKSTSRKFEGVNPEAMENNQRDTKIRKSSSEVEVEGAERKGNPFGAPNPYFQQPSRDEVQLPQSLVNNPNPTIGSNQQTPLELNCFQQLPRHQGSVWNPFTKKAEAGHLQKVLVSNAQLLPLRSQLSAAVQFCNEQTLYNVKVKEGFLSDRAEYLQKLGRLERTHSQRTEYQLIIKRAVEATALKEALIAEESRKVAKLQELRGRKNECLRKLFQLNSSRQALGVKRLSPGSKPRVNKFLAFNSVAKDLHNQAVNTTGSRVTIKTTRLQHH